MTQYNALDQLYEESVVLNGDTAHPTVWDLAYDLNGALKSKIKRGTVEDNTTFTYDLAGRLVETRREYPGSGFLGNHIDRQRMAYNEHGVRTQTAVYAYREANPVGTVTSTLYLVDQHNPSGYAQTLEERMDSDNVPTTNLPQTLAVVNLASVPSMSYAYGLGVLEQKSVGNTTTISYFLPDHQGTTRGLTSATGGLTATYYYDAYGNFFDASGNPIAAPTQTTHLYAMLTFDPASKLHYALARFLDTGSGRFVSQDPYEGSLQNPLTLPRYWYASADPVGNVDPSGLFSLGGLAVSIGIGTTLGALGGGAIGAAHGAIQGGIQGAVAGAWSGLLWGAAAGASIGGGGYALGAYFASLGVPVVQAFGAGTLVAGTPWRVANAISLENAIKSGDPVDIGFATFGALLGYAPVAEGVQFNAFIGGYLRTLPFVKSFEIVSRTEANVGTSGGGWDVAFASYRIAARITLATEKRWVRFIKAGENSPEGAWVVLESEVLGMTPQQIQQIIGSKTPPDHAVSVTTPVDTVFDVGQAGPQANWGVPNNGGLQFRIKSPTHESWFGDPQPIGSRFAGSR